MDLKLKVQSERGRGSDIPSGIMAAWLEARDNLGENGSADINSNLLFYPLAAATFQAKFSQEVLDNAYSHVISRAVSAASRNARSEAYETILRECNLVTRSVK